MIKKTIAACAAVMLLAQLMLSGISVDKASAAKRMVIVEEAAGRSFVPVRFTAEYLGFKVQWKSSEQQVILKNDTGTVTFTVGKKQAVVNGKQATLDAAPFNLAGTVYVPLRFAAEALGASVKYQKEGSVLLKNGTQQTTIPTVGLRRVERAINQPISTTSAKIQTSTKAVHVSSVLVDLFHPKVELNMAYANNKIGSVETLQSMAQRTKANVAVNGTFFNAYSTTEVQIPYGYIVQSGKVIHSASGDERAIFVYTKDGNALIADGESDLLDLLENDRVEAAVQAGPRLVRGGKVDTDPVAEGFKDPKVLTNSASRSAIGITAEGKLVIATTSGATMKELAEAMIKLGAVEAMNLDGGASSGLYANGKYITKPGRDLSNALFVTYQ